MSSLTKLIEKVIPNQSLNEKNSSKADNNTHRPTVSDISQSQNSSNVVDILGEPPKKDISPNNVEPKKRAHVQRACICGSTTHQRRGSYLCFLNR